MEQSGIKAQQLGGRLLVQVLLGDALTLTLSPVRVWALPQEQREEISISDAPVRPVQAPIRGLNCVLPLSFVVFLPRWAALMLPRPR